MVILEKKLDMFCFFSYNVRLIMRITRRSLIKGKDTFYVVTRDNRRVEEANYKTKYDAEERAYALERLVKEWDPGSVVGIVMTSIPKKIF